MNPYQQQQQGRPVMRPRPRPGMRPMMRPSMMRPAAVNSGSSTQPRMQIPRPGMGMGMNKVQAPRPRPNSLNGPRRMGRPMVPGPRPVLNNNNNPHNPNPMNMNMNMIPNRRQSVPMPQVKVDLSRNCKECFMSLTMQTIPNSNIILEQSQIPLAAVINPLSSKEQCPVADFGDKGVVRCTRCRGYINSFVVWLDNGRKWQCNLCHAQNETPAHYYRHCDENHQRMDREERAELRSGCYDIVATAEYMVRPPMSPVYVFLIDMSGESKRSGLMKNAILALKKNIPLLQDRTQIGVMGFDSAVHFYDLTKGNGCCITVPDLEDIFCPVPENLLVFLDEECRGNIDRLLDGMLLDLSDDVVQEQQQEEQTCLGAALDGAYKMMSHIGGRLAVFICKLPMLKPGHLTLRGANQNVLGTLSEHTLLRPNAAVGLGSTNAAAAGDQAKNGSSPPSVSFYKQKAIEFSRAQITCDLFCFPCMEQQYCDLATLTDLTRYSGGEVFYFETNLLAPEVAASQLRRELESYLSVNADRAWEAVMRVRATEGINPKGFYGNFLLRGSDLLALPSVSPDASFAVDFSVQDVEHPDSGGVSTFQAALLYTNSEGERRIRVLTSCFSRSGVMKEIQKGVNADVLTNLYARKGVDITFKTGLDDFKRKLQNKLLSINKAENELMSISTTLNMMKSLFFRGGKNVSLDLRIYLFDKLFRSSLPDCKKFFSPALVNLSNGEQVGLKYDNVAGGMFILNCGVYLIIHTTNQCALNKDVFGVGDVSKIDPSQLALFLYTQLENQNTSQPQSQIQSQGSARGKVLEAMKQNPFASLLVVVGGRQHCMALDLFRSLMFEERQEFSGGTMTLEEFTQFAKSSGKHQPTSHSSGMPPRASNASSGPPMAMPMPPSAQHQSAAARPPNPMAMRNQQQQQQQQQPMRTGPPRPLNAQSRQNNPMMRR